MPFQPPIYTAHLLSHRITISLPHTGMLLSYPPPLSMIGGYDVTRIVCEMDVTRRKEIREDEMG